MKLRWQTPNAWVALAISQFDHVLIDHAHCEKKAAANALSLLQLYPDIEGLPLAMANLAREESVHLVRVLRILESRGLELLADKGDPYAKGLQAMLRHEYDERRVDRLLVSALIEARSHERLQLLAEGLKDPTLKDFYAELAASEAGHQAMFVQLAERVDDKAIIAARLDVLIDQEAELMSTLPLRPAIH